MMSRTELLNRLPLPNRWTKETRMRSPFLYPHGEDPVPLVSVLVKEAELEFRPNENIFNEDRSDVDIMLIQNPLLGAYFAETLAEELERFRIRKNLLNEKEGKEPQKIFDAAAEIQKYLDKNSGNKVKLVPDYLIVKGTPRGEKPTHCEMALMSGDHVVGRELEVDSEFRIVEKVIATPLDRLGIQPVEVAKRVLWEPTPHQEVPHHTLPQHAVLFESRV